MEVCLQISKLGGIPYNVTFPFFLHRKSSKHLFKEKKNWWEWTNKVYSRWVNFTSHDVQPFNTLEWLASIFSLQDHPWFKHEGHENKGNDRQEEALDC